MVSERTEGAGEEKVLSPPLRDSRPPLAVRLVPVTDEAPCDGVAMEWAASWSVETVGAVDRAPAVGARPRVLLADERSDRVRPREVALDVTPLGEVERERVLALCGCCCCAFAAALPILPDSGYGLLFLDARCFDEDLACFEPVRLSSPEYPPLKFLSFLTSVANGRRLL